ncbi:MAG: serine/threonine protein kinase psk1 [Stictis urceolatum]|nr:serine/threonine protein kinase psk1 [Stictis urceolata]
MPGLTYTQLTGEHETETRVGRKPARRESTGGPVNVLLHVDDIHDTIPEETQAMLAPLTVHHRKMMEVAGTPPVAIPMSREASGEKSRSRSRARGDVDMDRVSAIDPNLTGRARRRRKKALKRGLPSAIDTMRNGGPTTPSGSGDEDSDFSSAMFKRRDISVERRSITSGPLPRPASVTNGQGGISALRQQLDALELEPNPDNLALARTKSQMSADETSSTLTSDSVSGSDVEGSEMTSYEVPFEEDFVSVEAEEEETTPGAAGLMLDYVHRKMTAQDFEPLTCLGKGTFGTVHLVRQQTTGKLFAQKMFRKASMVVQKSLIEQTKTERSILESVNRHPFVVKLYYAFQDHERLYLILEYAQGGELFTHLATEKMFPEDTAAFYMAELVLALDYLHHTVGVVYRDLKPENCLLDAEGHLLLTDFGLSKISDNDSGVCSSILGTVEYMAPEVILGHMYGTVVDWWSFGALGFDLLTGSPPFRGGNHKKIQENIVRSKLSLPYFLSPDAKDLLTRLLRKEPHKRLGHHMPKDMQTIKSHRFFRKINWKDLEKRELEPPIQPLITDPELAENFSADFTALALSPISTQDMPWSMDAEEHNPFGGFSYVASKSLLDYDGFL